MLVTLEPLLRFYFYKILDRLESDFLLIDHLLTCLTVTTLQKSWWFCQKRIALELPASVQRFPRDRVKNTCDKRGKMTLPLNFFSISCSRLSPLNSWQQSKTILITQEDNDTHFLCTKKCEFYLRPDKEIFIGCLVSWDFGK